MKKSYTLITFLLGLIIALSIAKAVLHNALSTSGIYVSKVEQEISSLKTENAILSEKLLVASSLTNIIQKAKDTGFNNDDALMIIGTSKPLALNQ